MGPDRGQERWVWGVGLVESEVGLTVKPTVNSKAVSGRRWQLTW